MPVRRPDRFLAVSTPSRHVAQCSPSGRRSSPRCIFDRLRLRRHLARSVPRVGRHQPVVRVWKVQVGRRARARPRRHHRAHVVGVRVARRQHGQDGAAPFASTTSCRSSTTSTAARRSRPTWPVPSRRSWWPGCPARSTSPTRARPRGTSSPVTFFSFGPIRAPVRPIATRDLFVPALGPQFAGELGARQRRTPPAGAPLLPDHRRTALSGTPGDESWWLHERTGAAQQDRSRRHGVRRAHHRRFACAPRHHVVRSTSSRTRSNMFSKRSRSL